MRKFLFVFVLLLLPFILSENTFAYRTARQHITTEGETFWNLSESWVNNSLLYPNSPTWARMVAAIANQNYHIVINDVDPNYPKMVVGQTYMTLSQQQSDDMTYQISKFITLNGLPVVKTITKENAGYVLANVWGNESWDMMSQAAKQLVLLEINTTDWLYFQGSYYKKIDTGVKTWYDSEKMCEDLGGKLASISNKAENDFVQTMCHPGEICRLGHNSPGGYCGTNLPNWVDGKPFIYTNWSKGEPDFYCGEDCLDMINDGKWNNEWCNNPYQYDKYSICEKPAK